jgi:hypothetical protein
LKNRVLYFPYIRVPESTWLTQMLLYWDKISSIVPYEFINRPGSLGPYMQSLLEQELVVQVIPGMYIYDIPNFEGAFQAYVDSLGPEVTRRRNQFEAGRTFKIHIEKMGEIGHTLARQGLAKEVSYSWYEVETDTANDFMSYLATVLGQLAQVDSSPVTDGEAYLRRFAETGVAKDRIHQQLQSLRTQVLEKVLPVPRHHIEPSAIREFKDGHGQLLGDFRRRVEREIVAAAVIGDDVLRQRQLDIFFEESAARIEEIEEAMHGERWVTTKASVSVLAAIPGVPQIFGLAAALWSALSGGQREVPSRDFAYAAYARKM